MLTDIAFPHIVTHPSITLRHTHIIPGTRADLDALSSQHYRAAPPVAVSHILSAVDGHSGEVIGVLAISRPPLNDSWRSAAWPDVFPPGISQLQRAARINAHVRIISRVIVTPARRSLSIARDLVAHYLAHPLTMCTEAVAAMGDIVPFFQRAGMSAIALPVSQRDRVLLRQLCKFHCTPLDLAGLDHPSAPIPDGLVSALRTWARAHRSTRSLANRDPVTLGIRAAASLLSPRAAYVFRTSQSD
jgi:hypothetical protein